MKQAEEAKLKSEAEKAAAAKAAFEATFKGVERAANEGKEPGGSDTEGEEEEEDLESKPVGPVDPAKCTAAGAGSPEALPAPRRPLWWSRRTLTAGSRRVRPGRGCEGSGDGTYTVTYAVPKRGNYMVSVECDGKPIMGSPFPVFFSTGPAVGSTVAPAPVVPYPNLVNQTMPNMPNYSGSVSGAFPGLLGMIPGAVPGVSGGLVLPGIGASLGEVCREYLSGRCSKSDCKYAHPPHNLLMMALAATTTMGTLSQQPMAPSAAAMAAAQAIVAAQALQAHAAQVQAHTKSKGDALEKTDSLRKTVQVSNLSPLLTAEHLKQLFGYCGTVVDCTIADSKHFAYIEYSKPEEAAAALHLNNMDVGGRPLNQSSLPLMMQQAVAMQQMQFQQSLIMQQNLAAQQAATRAATMKSATEMASARAAEISKKLKADMPIEDKEETRKSRSPSAPRPRSKSRSRSPTKHRRSRRSRSASPARHSRDRRSRTPVRSRHRSHYTSERRSYRDDRDDRDHRRRERERSRDHYSYVSRRNKSRSISPRKRKSSRAGSASPRRHRESLSPRSRKSSRAASKSPRHHRENKSSPRRSHGTSSRHHRRSPSRSNAGRHRSPEKEDKVEANRKGLKTEKADRKSRAAKDSGETGRDKAVDSSTINHGTSSRRGRHSGSVSPDGKDHSSDGEDKSKVDKKKLDDGKSYPGKLSGKDGENTMKDPRENKEDKDVDSSSISHKRGSLVSEDEASRNRKDHSKHKRSRTDDKDSERIDSTLKDPNLVADNSDDKQDKRAESSPVPKSHGKDSSCVEDPENFRHEKSSSKHRSHVKSDTAGREKDLGNDRRSTNTPTSKSHRNGSSPVDDLADRRRHDKSSSKHRSHDKDETVARGTELGDDRKVSESSSSRSRKRSSKRSDERYSEDAGDRSRGDNSKGDHRNRERGAATDESRYVDSDSGLGEERRESSVLKAERSGSLSPEVGSIKTPKNYRVHETSITDNGTSSIDNAQDCVNELTDVKSRVDINADNSVEHTNADDELKKHCRIAVLDEYVSFSSDVNDQGKQVESKLEIEEANDGEHRVKPNSVHRVKEVSDPVTEVQYSEHISEEYVGGGSCIILSKSISPDESHEEPFVNLNGGTDMFSEHAYTSVDQDHVDNESSNAKVYSSPKMATIPRPQDDTGCESRMIRKTVITGEDHFMLPGSVTLNYVDGLTRTYATGEEGEKLESSKAIDDETSSPMNILNRLGVIHPILPRSRKFRF
ncbi:unnamed protein product [Spirodela intermedia]|uniref:Uncharacterized protein n=1 Tax=Spirodela intermedia TaxID=51605 RepID=A0A7I8IPS2_SPIIN|nr:unnamed protein product [Spirodela intermedia]CAA6659880.1 unnamed protein product [Spirodela intermedia]